MSGWDAMCFKSSSMCDMSLDDMEGGFLESLPSDDWPLGGLDRLETPPPTPVLLSELEGSPLSTTADLHSPPADPELDGTGHESLSSVEALLESCGVTTSPEGEVIDPLLSPADLMWGASPTPVTASNTPEEQEDKGETTLQQEDAYTKQDDERGEKELIGSEQEKEQTKDKDKHEPNNTQKPQKKQTPPEKLQHQVQRPKHKVTVLLRPQQRYQHQHQQQHQQRHQQQKQQRRGGQSPPPVARPQWRIQPSSIEKLCESKAGSTPQAHRKARLIRLPAIGGGTTLPHIVICSSSIATSRPNSVTLPVTCSVLDKHSASRLKVRPVSAIFSTQPPSQSPVSTQSQTQARSQSQSRGRGRPAGVKRRVVGRAASFAKRCSVESSSTPSSPESPCATTLQFPHIRRRVATATAATQTGEPVDEVLRNSNSTLLRLLVTGQDLTNGYRLDADGQCQTPDRQPAPPSLFVGLPDRDSSALLSLLSTDEDPQLPALFPSEDDPL